MEGRHILWKPYGFRHILRADGRTTLCGNEVGWLIDRYAEWGGSFRDKIKYGKDTLHRPLCGTCRRLSEEENG